MLLFAFLLCFFLICSRLTDFVIILIFNGILLLSFWLYSH